MTNQQNKRKFVRLKATHLLRHIKFTLPGIDIFPTHEALSKDVSAGGLLFTSNRAYAVGDVIRLELHVPGWEKFKSEFMKSSQTSKSLPVLILAKVVRFEALGLGKFDIGAAFVGIDDGHQMALCKYIKQHLTSVQKV